MKKLIIVSGNFTKLGHFRGYTALGQYVHIFDRQMKGLGYAKGENENVKFPFFVNAEPKSYAARLNEKGEVVEGSKAIENRMTALSVFANKADFIQAFVAEASLESEINTEIQKAVTSQLLDYKKVEQLANASI